MYIFSSNIQITVHMLLLDKKKESLSENNIMYECGDIIQIKVSVSEWLMFSLCDEVMCLFFCAKVYS